MIRVPKPRKLIPATWADKAAQEVAAVAKYYKKWSPRKRAFKFKVYRDPEIKKVLVELFNFKCAYCEYRYKGGYPADIDHWRPKNAVRVDDKSRKPGYYWLASDWDNLFPACKYCNTANRHETKGVLPKTRGKLDQFPIQGARSRARLRPGREKGERPLLLNPSTDDPRLHLEYLEAGTERGVVKARAGRTNRASAKGIHSIEVYALDRRQLVEERRDLITSLLGVLRDLEKFAARHRARPNDAEPLTDFRDELESLRLNFLERDNPYLAVSRQFALPVLSTLVVTATLGTEVRAAINPTLPKDSWL